MVQLRPNPVAHIYNSPSSSIRMQFVYDDNIALLGEEERAQRRSEGLDDVKGVLDVQYVERRPAFPELYHSVAGV